MENCKKCHEDKENNETEKFEFVYYESVPTIKPCLYLNLFIHCIHIILIPCTKLTFIVFFFFVLQVLAK